MDSYYYQPSCPLHDPYPIQSYYYPSYVDQSPSMILYNNSTTHYYTQPSPPTQNPRSTPVVNTTFQSTPSVGRRRRQRTIFSKEHVNILDQVFDKTPYPDVQLLEELSQKLDIPEARIQVWFKNRRSRSRTSLKIKNQH